MKFFEALYKFSLMITGVKNVEEYCALAKIKKSIKKNRYAKFYKINTREASPLCASFFFDIYESVYNIQAPLARAEKSAVLKDIIAGHFLDDEKREAARKISPEYIESLAGEHSPAEITKIVNDNINAFYNLFTKEWFNTVNDIYNKIVYYIWFICFDYETLIKSFGTYNLHDFIKHSNKDRPGFPYIKCAEINESLKDFLAVTGIFSIKIDWGTVSLILTKYNPALAMNRKWTKLYTNVLYVLESRILTFMIQYTGSNPEWENKYAVMNTDFARPHIEAIVRKAQDTLSSLSLKSRENNIKELEAKIFDGNYIPSARYYNVKEREIFRQQGISGLVHAKAFEYLLSFMHKYFEVIYDICNIFFLKGVWLSREFSNDLSQIVHNISKCFDDLKDFDNSFSDDGEHGKKIKSIFTRFAGGTKYQEKVSRYMYSADKEADRLINETANCLSLLILNLNALRVEGGSRQNDFPSNNLIDNWSEIEDCIKNSGFPLPLNSLILKIDDLIKILQFTGSTDGD